MSYSELCGTIFERSDMLTDFIPQTWKAFRRFLIAQSDRIDGTTRSVDLSDEAHTISVEDSTSASMPASPYESTDRFS